MPLTSRTVVVNASISGTLTRICGNYLRINERASFGPPPVQEAGPCGLRICGRGLAWVRLVPVPQAAYPERMPEESPWNDSRDEAGRKIKARGIRVTIDFA